MTESKKQDKIDSMERLKDVVKGLYTSGSNNRQQKNGAHEKLITTIWESKHSVKTCGVDGILPKYLQHFLDTKKFPDSVECKGKTKSSGIKEIAQIILKLYEENSTRVYISITNVGKAYLQKILNDEELSESDYRHHFQLWGKYGVITQQEKSKNRPGKQKLKSS